ncbi:MAG: hypothetical protein IT450_02165 [Phycisphaerales bacterium]|nr:hypothetical protein [Phycisphaerales bacterium]
MSESGDRTPGLLRDGVPDWDAIGFDVTCVRCGYNLKMLEQTRCPECGLEFEWAQVVNYHRQTSCFLFEHQWRRKPVRSFFGTLYRTLSPRTFWTQVSIFEGVRVGPLIVLLFLAVVLFLLVFHGAAWAIGMAMTGGRSAASATFPVGRWPERWEITALTLQMIGRWPVTDLGVGYLTFVSTIVFTVLCAIGFLMLFGGSLGGCRVRRGQILRIFAYTLLPAAVIQPVILMGYIVLMNLGGGWFIPRGEYRELISMLTLLVVSSCVVALSLSLGLKHYLGIPRPWLVGCTTILVAALAVVTGNVVLRLLRYSV